MKRITKQIFSITLCVALLLSMLPAWALGVSDGNPREILEEAYALEDGMGLGYGVTLTGEIIAVVSPYDPYYENITVEMVIPGCETMPIQCYRLSGEGVDNLAMGDIITVSGYIWNYRGTIEFDQGCTLDAVIKGDIEVPKPIENPQELVDAAYNLEPGEKLPYMATLTGKIASIDTPYSEDFRNITVTIVVKGRESKPIVCYRMKGDGTETLAEGDIITVKGVLQNYAKYGEGGALLYTTVEFDMGCQLLATSYDANRLYCYTPWEQCYVYSWDTDSNEPQSGDWPGTLMTHEADGMWSCEVPVEADFVIFNSGDGAQTRDLGVPTDDRIMYMVEFAEWMELHWPGPNPGDWGPDSLTIVGMGFPGLDAWNPADLAGDMVEVAPYFYQLILAVPANSDLNFKFVGNHMWDDAWTFGGTGLALGQQIDLDCGGSAQDLYLHVDEACTLQFTVDLSPMRSGGNAMLLVDAVNPVDYPRPLTVVAPESWGQLYIYTWDPYTYGDFPGKKLQRGDDFYWDAISSQMERMVISAPYPDGGYWNTDVIDLRPGVDGVTVIIEEDGSYTVYYDDYPDDIYRVVGNTDWMGNWNCASDAGRMYLIADGVYQAYFENVQPGNYEFKITVNGTWDNSIGDSEGLNFAFNVFEATDVYVTYYEQTGDVDIYLENSHGSVGPDNLTLVGSGLPGIREWDPADPAGEMTQIADLVYQKTLEFEAGTIIEFKFVGNNAWDNQWNLGANPGVDFALDQLHIMEGYPDGYIFTLYLEEDCRLTFTVDLGPMYYGGCATLLVETVEELEPTRMLTVFAPDTWQYVNAYTWDPDTFGYWPGIRMEQYAGHYLLTIPASMVNLVLNGYDAQGNSYQTPDIRLQANGRDVFVTIHEDGNYTVEYEGGDDHSRLLTVVAPSSFDDLYLYTWDPAEFGDYPGMKIERQGDGNYYTLISSQMTNLIISNTRADGSRGQTNDIHLEPGIAPVTVILREDYSYLVIYDGEPTGNVYRVVGNAPWMGDWDSASDLGLMSQIDDGVYQKCFENVDPGYYEFKITVNGVWDNSIGASEFSNFVLDLLETSDVYVTYYEQTGEVDICAVSSSGNWGFDRLAMLGDGIPGVPDWNDYAPESQLTEVADNVFEKTLYLPAGTSMLFWLTGLDSLNNNWSFSGQIITLGSVLELKSSSDLFPDSNPDLYPLDLYVSEDCRVKITVDLNPVLNGGNATFLAEKLDTDETRLLTVVTPDSWMNPYIYSWEPYTFGEFPGTALYYDGIYYWTRISSQEYNMVISGYLADGTLRTSSDIRLEAGSWPVAIVIFEDGSYCVSYDEPQPADDILRVVGNTDWMGWWDAASDLGLMEKNFEGVFQKYYTDVQPGSYEFKITRNGKWDEAIGNADGTNFTFEVSEVSDVSITCLFDAGDWFVNVQVISQPLGDVTGDGSVNLGDVARIYAHARGAKELTDPSALACADFNGDGRVNLGDVAGIYAHLRSMIVALPEIVLP